MPDLPTTSEAASAGSSTRTSGSVWPAVNAHDALGVIRFLVDVLGFTERLVVPGAEPGIVEHSQLRWRDGGTVQVSSASRDSIFSRLPTGSQAIYLVTPAVDDVYRSCVAAGAEIAMEPISPPYDPDGSVFTVRDPEGNLWSIGTYAGE